MAVEVWQVVQIKRVLDTFCTEHQLEADDDAALKVCDHLLRATSRDIDDAEQLFNHLSQTFAAEGPTAAKRTIE